MRATIVTRACTSLCLALLAWPVLAGETLQELTCKPSTVEGRASQPTTVNVLTLNDPGITAKRYAVQGKVKYSGVEGQGYLESWNHFPGQGRFFSRSLGVGAMAPLTGSSGWRDFSLPFSIIKDDFPPPGKIVVNVVLPGRGTVELGQLRLLQFGEHEDPTLAPGQWWGGSLAGLVGGIAGSLIGCLGGLIGWLSSRGRARRFVLGTMRLLIVLGLAALGLGVYAVLEGQPSAVFYPLLLIGIICVAVLGGLFPGIRRRYDELELRRMRAQDA